MCTQYGELCTILTHSSSSYCSYAIPRCIPPRTVELTLISPVWSLPTTSSLSQQSQKNCPIQATKSCSNSTKLLYGPRTKKASSLYVRTTSKLLSTYLANGWLVAKAVVLGHFLEFSDRQQQAHHLIAFSAFFSHCQCHKKRQAILLVLEELFGRRRCLLM